MVHHSTTAQASVPISSSTSYYTNSPSPPHASASDQIAHSLAHTQELSQKLEKSLAQERMLTQDRLSLDRMSQDRSLQERSPQERSLQEKSQDRSIQDRSQQDRSLHDKSLDRPLHQDRSLFEDSAHARHSEDLLAQRLQQLGGEGSSAAATSSSHTDGNLDINTTNIAQFLHSSTLVDTHSDILVLSRKQFEYMNNKIDGLTKRVQSLEQSLATDIRLILNLLQSDTKESHVKHEVNIFRCIHK